MATKTTALAVWYVLTHSHLRIDVEELAPGSHLHITTHHTFVMSLASLACPLVFLLPLALARCLGLILWRIRQRTLVYETRLCSRVWVFLGCGCSECFEQFHLRIVRASVFMRACPCMCES